MDESLLKKHIRDIPDFPKPGVIFKDITPLLADTEAFRAVVHTIADHYADAGVTKVAGIEARGFIFAAPVAMVLGAGFIPVRKPGKLPYDVKAEEYELEYGTDKLEIHQDAVTSGQPILMVDDLLATGGTMKASCDLIEKLGGRIIGATVLIELAFLQGRRRLGEHGNVHAVIRV